MANVLKELLGDLYTDEIAKKAGDVKLIILDEGKYIPVDKFNVKLDEIKQLKEQVDDYKKQLKDLEKKAQGNADLQQTIQELRAENEKKDTEYQSKIAEQAKRHAIESAIKDAQGKNIKAISALLDIEKITVDDKGITGLSDQLKQIKESDAYLFGEDKIVGTPPADNAQPVKPKDLQAQYKEATERGDLLAAVSLKRRMAEAAGKKLET
jgi:hypothetical protein